MNVIKVIGTVLYCKACESNVSHDQKSHVSQHLKTQLHLRKAELTRSKVQTSIQYPSDNRSHRWAAALVKAGIPLNKLENSEFRKFIEGEVGYKLPSESSLRKTYLEKEFAKEKENMFQTLGSEDLYFLFDETKNRHFQSVAAILVGAVNSPAKPSLLALKIIDKVNGDTASQFLTEYFYQNGFKTDQFRVFVTDGAAYCLKAGRTLKCIFPQLRHLTCVSHATHLSMEDVRKRSNKADRCIASLKAALSKCTERRGSFPVAMPPWPILTRWGTWVKCGIFVAKNWDKMCEWVLSLDDEGMIVENVKTAFRDPEAQAELSNLLSLEKALEMQKELQTQGLTLAEQFTLLDDFKGAVFGTEAEEKFNSVIQKNPDLQYLRENLASRLSAPITSCEIERLFSVMKVKEVNSANISSENLQKLFFIRLI